MGIGRLKYVDMNPVLDRQDEKSTRRKPSPIQQSTGQEPPLGGSLAVEAQVPSSQNTEVRSFHHQNTHEGTPRHTRSTYPIGPLHRLPDTHADEAYMSLEEACLIRHFGSNLSQWVCIINDEYGAKCRQKQFDISDRDRHFTLCVPERSIFCPVLRYAVYTASAGHLTRLHSCQGHSNGVISFDGIPLPGLGSGSAIRYHSICISLLIEISNDEKEQYNEDVLTAATILRFYEQIEG